MWPNKKLGSDTLNYVFQEDVSMVKSRKPQKREGIARVKIYLNGKWVPLSEAAKKIEAPLTKTSKELLSVLMDEREPVSPKQLSVQLKRTQTTIYRSLKNLEKKNLVVKIRRGLVALTEEGYEKVKKLGKKR